MNQAEEMDPVNLAFANQLIFDKIRTFLPKLGPTLRLVCKTWNDRILSSSRPKLVLKLYRYCFQNHDLCCDPLTFQRFIMTMDPRLATHVQLWSRYFCVYVPDFRKERDQHFKSLMVRLSHLCEKFGDMIQTLVVLVRASMLPILYELLSRCCPNLKNLRIMEWTLTPSERGEETSLAWDE
ncbi:uncharacterized protein LOC118437128 [Folsomia candida]|uniref:uncharacterized protein LOC118437128 n=1 Tax=Folsomia candida TaxID=158441 RepID=UPI0016055ADA|nr:uncharacterized protein LOC118437128 [Folsomia candida]